MKSLRFLSNYGIAITNYYIHLQVPLRKGIKKTVEYFRSELKENKNSMKHTLNHDQQTNSNNYIEEEFTAIPHL